MKRPAVSVVISCYNFERYIYECLYSLVTQVTSFPFEIIIVDDCSTDASISEIERVMQLFPNKIQLIKQQKNRGSDLTKQTGCNASVGKYIAFLDGDDFSYPNKLQLQFDYLESNPDCVLCYHDMELVNDNSELLGNTFAGSFYNQRFIPEKAEMKDLILYGTFIVASSQMFRREAYKANLLPASVKIVQDFYYHVHTASCGRFGRIDSVCGAYRQHSESFTAKNALSVERRFTCLNDILSACDYALSLGLADEIVKKGRSHFYYAAALYFLKRFNESSFLECIEKSENNGLFFDIRHKKLFLLKSDFNASLAYFNSTLT